MRKANRMRLQLTAAPTAVESATTDGATVKAAAMETTAAECRRCASSGKAGVDFTAAIERSNPGM